MKISRIDPCKYHISFSFFFFLFLPFSRYLTMSLKLSTLLFYSTFLSFFSSLQSVHLLSILIQLFPSFLIPISLPSLFSSPPLLSIFPLACPLLSSPLPSSNRSTSKAPMASSAAASCQPVVDYPVTEGKKYALKASNIRRRKYFTDGRRMDR